MTAPAAAIGRLFSSIPKVVSIYQDLKDNDDLVFWVFTSNERYDDELLDRLITLEMEIMRKYPLLQFVFWYVPAPYFGNEKSVVGDTAQVIFTRQRWRI